MTEQQNELHRSRQLLSNMTQEQIDEQQRRHVLSNMIQEQAQHHCTRNLVENFSLLGQEWDYDNVCEFCKHAFLKSQTGAVRSSCCKDGAWCDQSYKTIETQMTTQVTMMMTIATMGM